MRSVPVLLAAIALLAGHIVLLAGAGTLQAAEPVTVHLLSGRSFTGLVDPQTSAQELVLRFEDGTLAMWRPIAWQRIRAAEYQGAALSMPELQTLAAKIQSSLAEEVPLPPSEPQPGELDDSAYMPNPADSRQTVTAPAEATPFRRVHSIAVRAELANWNAGVEMDGLLLTVWPLDAYGQVLDVSGTVQVELVGFRPASARSMYSYARGNPFQPLAQWSQSVQASGSEASGVQFQLPFQAIHPEFATDFAAYGMVQVRMAIPGHGTFSATENVVRIRPFSPLRDAREQLHLHRFFPQEQLTRTH